MLVRAIPWSAFRHLSGSNRKVNTQYLADVWSFAFEEARTAVLPSSFNSHGLIRVNVSKMLFVAHVEPGKREEGVQYGGQKACITD